MRYSQAMTLDEVNLLVDYNYWARDRLLESVAALNSEQFTRGMGNSFGSVRDTIAHICDAESIWMTRWSGGQPTGFQRPDRIPDLETARKEWAELENRMRGVVRGLSPADVDREISYKDFRGADRSDIFWQTLQHVVNHGSYHRGQVTTMLRQLGAQPPKFMDLIVFYRERRQI